MAKEERGFRYQQRGKDTLKERANMKGGNYDSYIKPKYKQWKPKEGKNNIRVLPPTWDDARHYGLDIFVNYSIGADNQAYLSLGKHNRGADPIAEARREAQQEGEKDLAKKLNPSQRILYWIIDRNDEDEGPLLWAAPFTFDKALSNLCIDEDTKDVIFIDDPAKGRDVRFYREGTGLNTEYDASKMKILKASLLHEDEAIEIEWLDFINDNPLPEVLNFYDYDHIKAVFDGQGSKSEDDDETEKKPSRPRGRVDAGAVDEKPARRTRPQPADDDDAPKTRGPRRDQEESGDEAIEEEAPVARRKKVVEDEKPARTRQRAVPDAEPDDEAEDEKPVRGKASRQRPSAEDDPIDEEDEKPARRSRVSREDPEEEVDPPSTRRTSASKDDAEESGSLRERLAARRRSRTSED